MQHSRDKSDFLYTRQYLKNHKHKKKCNWRKVAGHKLRSLCLVVLDVSTSRYHLPDFFSVSPSSNPLFCPVSLSIKSPLPVEIFLPLNVY